MLLNIDNRRIIFVGGKGGVGKTSIASSLAVARAQQGARVLVVSTDPAHNLGHLWHHSVGDMPVRLVDATTPGWQGAGAIDGVEIDPAATVERHLAAVEATMIRMLPERLHSQTRAHLERARHAPGSHESAVLERIAEAAATSRGEYDVVIFDTAPSGHTLRLLALPGQLTDWTETLLRNRDRSERYSAAMRSLAGRQHPESDADAQLRRVLHQRKERFEGLRTAITDASSTGFVVVSTAEAMPVAETIEVIDALTALHVDIAGLVVNRRSPLNAGTLLARRRAQEDHYLQMLKAHSPAIPLIEVPLMAEEVAGLSGLSSVARVLRGSEQKEA
ncbi:ArsA family ATPase [Microbacterium sp. YY-01]|uniref:ArsA family ATPase n=1 Tax=Microbacterium sp. YY-01 TaxID=3421634 RepID=UPI003D17378A